MCHAVILLKLNISTTSPLHVHVLARLANEKYRDKIDAKKARDLAYILKALLEAHEKGDIESRLEELEKKLMEKD